MKQFVLLLAAATLAACGDLNNEYLPPGRGVISNGAFEPSQSKTSAFPKSSTLSGSYPAPGFGQQSSFVQQQQQQYTPSAASQYSAPAASRDQFARKLQYGAPVNQQALPATKSAASFAPQQAYNAPSFPVSQYSSSGVQRLYQSPSPAPQYNAPFSARAQAPAPQYGAPSQQGFSSVGQQYSAPGAFSARSQAPASQYGAPSQQGFSSVGQQYSAPSAFSARSQAPASQYGAPSKGGFSSGQQYSAPRAFQSQSPSLGAQSNIPQQRYQPSAAPQAQYGAPAASYQQPANLKSYSAPIPQQSTAQFGTVQDNQGGYKY